MFSNKPNILDHNEFGFRGPSLDKEIDKFVGAPLKQTVWLANGCVLIDGLITTCTLTTGLVTEQANPVCVITQ